MEKQSDSKLIKVGQIFLALICAASCVYTIANGAGSGGQQLPAVFCLAAIIATMYYIIRGYGKNASGAFKVMMLLCAFAHLMCIVPHMYNTEFVGSRPVYSVLGVLFYALSFGAYLVLALVPDLGIFKSMLLIAFVLLMSLAVVIGSVVLMPGSFVGGGTVYDAMRIMRHVAMTLLAVNAGTCNYFKYGDKEARGSSSMS